MKIKAIETNHGEVKRIAQRCKAVLTSFGIKPDAPLNEILRRLKILVFHVKMDPLVEGLAASGADIPNAGDQISPGQWCIFVNDRFSNHPDRFKGAVLVQNVIVHELAHILQRHEPNYLPLKGPGQSVEVSPLEALRLLINADRRLKEETEAELFAAEFTFRDIQRFQFIYYKTQADFRELANAFTAQLDCAVKWALLLHSYPMFYLKYNARTKSIEDQLLIEEEELPSKDVPQLILETVAEKKDCQRTITCIRGEKYLFNSYYLPEDPYLDAPAKVIVTALSEANRKLLKDLYDEANKPRSKTPPSKPAAPKPKGAR